MSKYVKLVGLTTNYATRMNRLSNQIFGNVKRPTNTKSLRVVSLFSQKPVEQIDAFVNYYPRHVETGKLMMKLREYGLYRDEHQDFKEEMVRLRLLRGKPKKGRQAVKKEKPEE